MIVMDPYEAKACMRFTTIVTLNNLSAKANTLIDITASHNFASKEFVMDNGLLKKCKTTPKLAIRLGRAQRISATKIFCPSVFTIDGHDLINLQFRVLPHF